MSKVAWIIFSAVIVAVLVGLVVYSRVTNPPISLNGVNTNAVIAASEQNGNIADHTYGIADSKAVLIEYGDFQCPSCGAAHPQVKALTDEYKDKMTFVYRNFPLTSIHPNARAAAAAVEAAGLQGKYWEMHNLIFENQDSWNTLEIGQRTETFANYATSLGLNKEQFITDAASSEVNKKISFDQAVGKEVGVNATPSFYFNGEKLDTETANGIVQGDTLKLKSLIDAALAK